MNFSDLLPADYLFLSSGLLIEDQQKGLSIHQDSKTVFKYQTQFSVQGNGYFKEYIYM